MRTLTYYIGVSLDGFIAGPEHQTDGFDVGPELISHIVEHYPETLPSPVRTGLEIADVPNRRFDTVVMGAKTYGLGLEQGLTNPYGHLEQVVLSSSLNTDVDPAVTVTADDAATVVDKLKDGDGLGVWLCGGGQLAGALINQIDELILKRYPVSFGTGRPLFDGSYRPTRFELVNRDEIGQMGKMWIETYRPQ